MNATTIRVNGSDWIVTRIDRGRRLDIFDDEAQISDIIDAVRSIKRPDKGSTCLPSVVLGPTISESKHCRYYSLGIKRRSSEEHAKSDHCLP